MKIELNKTEATSLVELIDVAQKALGLRGSQNCLFLAGKINAVLQKEIDADNNADDKKLVKPEEKSKK